jgi:hypothetical protein
MEYSDSDSEYYFSEDEDTQCDVLTLEKEIIKKIEDDILDVIDLIDSYKIIGNRVIVKILGMEVNFNTIDKKIIEIDNKYLESLIINDFDFIVNNRKKKRKYIGNR